MGNYFEELINHFARLAADSSPEATKQLRDALAVRDSGTYEKHIIPHLASGALIAKGICGIEELVKALPDAPGYIYPMAILASLWRASEGESVEGGFGIGIEVEIFKRPIPANVSQFARLKLVSFLDDCRKDPESLSRLINLLHHEQLAASIQKESWKKFQVSVFKILSDATLKISEPLLTQFEQLLSASVCEEEYHRFLAQNPVFLHPLASQVTSKHKLGDDLVTDYVVQTLTDDWIAVEIEKPSDPVFTQAGDFSKQFTHAFGQVIDFIEWFEQNVSYAQKKLPGIVSPRGLLVIGRTAPLTQPQLGKLRRFNRNSSAIEVVTFDDLLSRSRLLLNNIRHRIVHEENSPQRTGQTGE